MKMEEMFLFGLDISKLEVRVFLRVFLVFFFDVFTVVIFGIYIKEELG